MRKNYKWTDVELDYLRELAKENKYIFEITELMSNKFNHEFRTCWPNSVALIGDNGDVILRFNDYQGMHRFWNNVAKEHGLEYYTTYGIYEGKDAYIDKYYPETKDDVGDMSSHRTFKQ